MTREQVIRGRERLRRIRLTGVATITSRGVNIAGNLISIPLAARYLGAERFGIWLLLGSFLTWASLADLGLANTLTTELARADGQDDRTRPRILVSSATFSILLIACTVAVAFAAVYPWIPWARVFNVSDATAIREAGAGAAITMVLFVARLPLAIPSRVYAAYQEAYRYQLWAGAFNVAALFALLGAIAAGGSIAAMLGAFYGTSLLGDIGSAGHLFWKHRPWLAPSPLLWNWQVSRSLLGTGTMFWIAQIAAILLLETDLIIVAQMYGAARVADYGVALKLFSLIALGQMAFASALWPAYAEALARRDLHWVNGAFTSSIRFAVIWSAGASTVLIAFGGWGVRLLVGTQTVPDRWLLAAMATTAIATVVGQSFAMLLNGLGEIRIQALLGVFSGLFNIGVSLLLARWVGVPGVALGTTAAILASLATSAGFLRARLRSLQSGASVAGGPR